jgi:hypothetical protein
MCRYRKVMNTIFEDNDFTEAHYDYIMSLQPNASPSVVFVNIFTLKRIYRGCTVMYIQSKLAERLCKSRPSLKERLICLFK